MKVLHLYKTYFPETLGGVEQVINEIILSTQKIGVSAEVFTLTKDHVDRTDTFNGYLVHRCRSNFEIASTPFSISAFKYFSELLKQVDIIHYHYPWPFMDLQHFLCRVQKPSLVTYHSDIIRQKYLLSLYQPLLKRFLSNVDCIVATSPNYLATSEVLQPFVDKTKVISIGLNKENYPDPSDEILHGWKRKSPDRFFLFIGVLRYYKGLHFLIEAAKFCQYPIVVVGSGPIEKELKLQVKTLGLKNIYFLGKLSHENKVALLKLCYAMVFPSDMRSEAFGVSLLEGAMFGKPMISSEIGTGTTFINIDKETGLVVPPGDSLALSKAMQFLWENPQEAAVMGKHAQLRYWNHFTAQKMGEAYVDLYKNLSH